MMTDLKEFARFDNQAFVETRWLPTQPDPNPAKNITWHPVGATIHDGPPGWSVVKGAAIQTIAPAPTPAPRRIGEPWEFIDLFTDAEFAAVAMARQSSVALDKWFTLTLAAPQIDLDSARVQAGVAALVTASLITQERADDILGGAFV
jgi:hypothetical protein